MAKAVIIIGEALMHLGCIYAELLGTMPMLAQAAGGGILREKAPDSGSMLIAERQCETVIDSAYGPHGISNHVLMCQIRSEEHTSELQSLMRISYAVFCLKQKNNN